MIVDIDRVAQKALKHFASALHPQAIRIFTPLPNPVPLDSCNVSPGLKDFLLRYEPKLENGGLLPHQAEFLNAYAKRNDDNFVITTGTGTGKSLCFWAWVFDKLSQKDETTAIVCFPTQALMWGQAERLARISEKRTLAKPDRKTVYAGAVRYGTQLIGWTVWYGVGSGATRNDAMAEHENTETFKSARIRIATLDKAHWSLFRSDENKEFAKRLSCVVIDEAHTYQGVFGANVHYFLKRLYLTRQIFRSGPLALFLASATLSSARKFAATLISEHETKIVSIGDSTQPVISLISLEEVPEQLSNPPEDGLLRIILLVNDQDNSVRLWPFVENEKLIGSEVNAIYFSQNKFVSRLLNAESSRRKRKRNYLVYDADLPPHERRDREGMLNDPNLRGTTVIATSALELGVDIEGLDVCVMDDLPPRRVDLLQRIGRVGRRPRRPGLTLLRLSAEPRDQQILEDPHAAFQIAKGQILPIPIHLDNLRWKHALAAFSEWESEFNSRRAYELRFQLGRFQTIMEAFFGISISQSELLEQFEHRYGSLVDTADSYWTHKGFRASTSQSKIPLKEGNREVARIDDSAVFRDAHPEAVFLGHDGHTYRVKAYEINWKIAKWTSPNSNAILGKWLPALKAVQVRREKGRIATRGIWDDSAKPYDIRPRKDENGCPKKGLLEFGVFDHVRKWRGYVQIDLKTGETKKVSVEEVTKRFVEALEQGCDFPFLHNLSWRTQGWEWTFGAIDLPGMESDQISSLGQLVADILSHFFALVLETIVSDVVVNLKLSEFKLQVNDSLPGGSGVSEALLYDGRVPAAFKECIKTLAKYDHRGTSDSVDANKHFIKYVTALGHATPSHSAREVMDVVEQLRLRWTG